MVDEGRDNSLFACKVSRGFVPEQVATLFSSRMSERTMVVCDFHRELMSLGPCTLYHSDLILDSEPLCHYPNLHIAERLIVGIDQCGCCRTVSMFYLGLFSLTLQPSHSTNLQQPNT